MANLGHAVSDTTVANVLKENGLEPAPLRRKRTPWKEFLKAHWDQLSAVDFTSVEVWTPRGLVTFYALFSRRNAIRENLAHDHTERNHQGMDSRLIEPVAGPPPDGVIDCRERPGGMLKHYQRLAA